MVPMEIDGGKIRQARLNLKAATAGKQGSQSWLAAQIGAHPTSVSDWERGDTQPSLRHLRALSLALRVPLEAFYADDDAPFRSEAA